MATRTGRKAASIINLGESNPPSRPPPLSALGLLLPLVLPVLPLALLPLASGCVQIDGGAIEASWVLRTFDGRAITGCACASPQIARVRFTAVAIDATGQAQADICAGRAGCEFSCASQRGATPFFVPAGRYAIAVAALTAEGHIPAQGEASGEVRVPAPILRDVVYGQPTQLEAIAIEADCDPGCGGSSTTRACSKD